MYSMVLAAHHAALAAVRPGATASDVARAGHDLIAESGYHRYAAPRLGRGLGRGHQEGPWLGPADEVVLEPGMTLCLEPAIHLPDLFGARIADVVACTTSGAALLSTGSRDLHVLVH